MASYKAMFGLSSAVIVDVYQRLRLVVSCTERDIEIETDVTLADQAAASTVRQE